MKFEESERKCEKNRRTWRTFWCWRLFLRRRLLTAKVFFFVDSNSSWKSKPGPVKYYIYHKRFAILEPLRLAPFAKKEAWISGLVVTDQQHRALCYKKKEERRNVRDRIFHKFFFSEQRKMKYEYVCLSTLVAALSFFFIIGRIQLGCTLLIFFCPKLIKLYCQAEEGAIDHWPWNTHE